jgi:vacuolar-type H+-ATPase subunit E/Vma4
MSAGRTNRDLIEKMKASIRHQATTNAVQIREQATQDADRMKTRTVYQAKLKIKDENKLKKKQVRSQKSVRLSVVNGGERMKILCIRDEAVNRSVDIAAERLREFAQGPSYPKLLNDLVLQALIALGDADVAVAVKASDQDVIRQALPALTSAAKEKLALPEVTVKLSDYVLPDAAIGGCVLIAKGGKIQCSNTLMDRLMLACKDLYPEINRIFGSTTGDIE